MKIKITVKLVLAIVILSILALIGLTILMGKLLVFLVPKLALPIFIFLLGSFTSVAVFVEIMAKLKVAKKKKQALKIGGQIFPTRKQSFKKFYNSYINNQKSFLSRYNKVFDELESLDRQNLKPIEALYIFARGKRLVHLVDWKGEDDLGETEAFINDLLKRGLNWENAFKCRTESHGLILKDGEFIIHLFKAIDIDLSAVGHRLLFLDLNWDAYVYTAVPNATFAEINRESGAEFHGTDRLSV